MVTCVCAADGDVFSVLTVVVPPRDGMTVPDVFLIAFTLQVVQPDCALARAIQVANRSASPAGSKLIMVVLR